MAHAPETKAAEADVPLTIHVLPPLRLGIMMRKPGAKRDKKGALSDDQETLSGYGFGGLSDAPTLTTDEMQAGQSIVFVRPRLPEDATVAIPYVRKFRKAANKSGGVAASHNC